MALVENIRVKSSDVADGLSTVDQILPTTPDTAGSFVSACAAGGFVQVNKPVDATFESAIPAGTTLESTSTVTSKNQYFTMVPQGNVTIRGGKYVHERPASTIRTPIGGVRKLLIENLDITGSVTPDGAASYAVDIRDSNDVAIKDVSCTKYTGAVFLNGSRQVRINNLDARELVYHPSLVAGGYGVLMANARNVVIDGLYFAATASQGTLGRHAFYVSNNGDASTKCSDITLNNVYATYTAINNRNMWTGVVRTSDNVRIHNLNTRGGNGGIAINVEQGQVSALSISDSSFSVEQYDASAVYAITGAGISASPQNDIVGCTVQNCRISVKRAASAMSSPAACVALSFGGRNSRFSNLVIDTDTGGGSTTSPIILHKSVYLSFDGITQIQSSTLPLFYLNDTVDTASFSNIQSIGPIFDAQNLVQRGVNITVDWNRTANIGVSAGSLTKADADALIQSVTWDGTTVTVVFNAHVTAKAVETATVNSRTGTSAYIVGKDASARTLGIRSFSGSTLINPTTGTVNFDVTLYC